MYIFLLVGPINCKLNFTLTNMKCYTSETITMKKKAIAIASDSKHSQNSSEVVKAADKLYGSLDKLSIINRKKMQ